MDVVTGAFSFLGRYVAARLLEDGREVRTLTRRPPEESPFGDRVRAFPLDFGDPGALAEAMRGADTLYNTYWLRVPRAGATFADAVASTGVLLAAARAAGVGRVVQLSVTGAEPGSPFPYFRAKAEAEELLARSGLPFAVVRPTLVFGRGEVLVNDIAWLLRRFPLFVVPSGGRYPLQPVAAEDVADLCVGATPGEAVDAAGPDVLAFGELVRIVREAVGSRARIVRGSPRLAVALARGLGRVAGGTLLTADELAALAAGTLTSAEPPRGRRRFADWLAADAELLGARFASDRERPWPG